MYIQSPLLFDMIFSCKFINILEFTASKWDIMLYKSSWKRLCSTYPNPWILQVNTTMNNPLIKEWTQSKLCSCLFLQSPIWILHHHISLNNAQPNFPALNLVTITEGTRYRMKLQYLLQFQWSPHIWGEQLSFNSFSWVSINPSKSLLINSFL